MQIVKGRERIGNILFTVGIILELLIMLVGHCSWLTLPYSGRIAQVAFVLFGCKIITTRYSKREWMIIVLAGLLGIISYLTKSDEYILRAIVMVVAAKDIDEMSTYKTIFWPSLVATLVIIVLSLLGIRGEMVDIRDYGRVEGIEARWCLGFNHANNVHCMYWYLIALFMYIRKGVCRWWTYIIFIVADVGLCVLTRSKTGLLAVALIVIASAYSKYRPEINTRKWPYFAGVVSIFACVAMTILGASYGNFNKVSKFLDLFLNQRLNMIHDIAYIGDWKLFPEARTMRKIVDSGMGNFAYQYGILLFILMILLLLYMIWLSYKEKNVLLLTMIITYMYVWFMETSFAMNTSLLCTTMYIILFNRWYKGIPAHSSEDYSR